MAALLLPLCALILGPADAAAQTLSGKVVSGPKSSPISGAEVTLMAAGITYGAATSLGATSSASDGSFSFSYTCPAGNPEIYVTALAGDAGEGTNPSLGLLALLGPCESLGTLPSVVLNELTTVAAEWALAQFSDPAGQQFGAPPSNGTGLANAVSLARFNLVSSANGFTASPLRGVAASCTQRSPAANCNALERLNSLANLLLACVESSSSSNFFACESLSLNTGKSATTLQAAHVIATNPATNVSSLFLAANSKTLYKPSLPASSPPVDFTLALNYTGGGLSHPNGIAIDAAGNIWAADPSPAGVSEFTSLGAPAPGSPFVSPQGAFGIAIDHLGNVWIAGNPELSELTPTGTLSLSTNAGGLDAPSAVAIDQSGNVWVKNTAGSAASEFNATGTALSPAAGYLPGEGTSGGIAFDKFVHTWITEQEFSKLLELNSSGSVISPPGGYVGGGLDLPTGVAIDPSGNVWVTNLQADEISEFGPTGTALSPATGYPIGATSQCLAVDSVGHIWVATWSAGGLYELSSTGALLSPSKGFNRSAMAPASGQDIAIDAQGDVWIGNFSNNSLTEVIGVAAPVRTPLIGLPKLP